MLAQAVSEYWQSVLHNWQDLNTKQPPLGRRNGEKGQHSGSLDSRPGSPAKKKQKMTDEGQTCRSSMGSVERIADYIHLCGAKKNMYSNCHSAQMDPSISKPFST